MQRKRKTKQSHAPKHGPHGRVEKLVKVRLSEHPKRAVGVVFCHNGNTMGGDITALLYVAL